MVPPTLDLSGATHSKMMVVPPRMNLRRAASYQGDKGPLSATSSRFGFNHLMFASPPPSPRLPTLVPPRPRKTSNPPRPSRVLKTVLYVAAATAMAYMTVTTVHSRHKLAPYVSAPVVDMIGQVALPDFATPVVFDDDSRRGPSWTVFVPHGDPFPMSIQGYADMVSMCRGVSLRVGEMRTSLGPVTPKDHSAAIAIGDAHFLDVREAEAAGLLPGGAISHGADPALPTCESSITYILESTDAGIGKALMAMWTAYGVAQRQGRAFFVDDTRWAYGRYGDIFENAPDPGCSAPRRHEVLPCPLTARHLAINFATVEAYVSAALEVRDEEDDEGEQRERFDLARRGYEALFRLQKEDAEYVNTHVADLRGRTRALPGQRDGIVVGLHVRRGDRRPLEFQYRDSYVPLTAYADTARRLIHEHTGSGGDVSRSLMVLASDDPTVYDSEDLAVAAHAQDRIRLATKAAIQQANPPDRRVMHKFVDDTFGWDGGFFAAMFWNLGISSAGAAHAAHRPALSKGAAASATLRSYMARAYAMDLAVLAAAADDVVCTVSAAACRILAVMMGWERAFEDGRWVNIDGSFGWSEGEW